MADGAELILRGLQPAIQLAAPVSAFNLGMQDQNTLASQLLNNQLLQQRYSQAEQTLDQAKQGQLIRDMQTIATEALQMPGQSRRQHILGRLKAVDFAGLDENELINEIGQLDDTQLEQSLRSMMSAADTSEQTAEMRTFNAMTQGMTPEEKAGARKVWAGIQARAGESAQERIARTGKTGEVAQSEAEIAAAKAGASEEATLSAQSRLLPDIRASIKRAESEATAQGETVTALTRAKAAMPGLLDVSDKLKKLADVATYTTTGKLVDLAAKELGFGSTKGGTARSTMTSIVDNQVLPLLRDTFGAAFTVAEGDRLRDSLLDPDASPDAKKATLDAFIDQKYRNIETQERELGIGTTQNKPARIRFDAQGNAIQ